VYDEFLFSMYLFKPYFLALNDCLKTKIILQIVLLDCDFKELNLSSDISGRLRGLLSREYVKRSEFQSQGI
jgi:hypothetical protein